LAALSKLCLGIQDLLHDLPDLQVNTISIGSSARISAGMSPIVLRMLESDDRCNSLIFKLFSLLRRRKFPVPVAQGICPQAFELARRLDAKIAAKTGNLQNSLLISLLSGNLGWRLVRSGLHPPPHSPESLVY
jgi:hypothetical protein